jgi:hypothetical protein
MWRRFLDLPWYSKPYPVLIVGLLMVLYIWPVSLSIINILLFPAIWGMLLNPWPKADALSMMADPSAGKQFPADVSLRYSGSIYGEDSGIVTFMDHWLLFDGKGCSFCINRADATAVGGFGSDFRVGYSLNDSVYEVRLRSRTAGMNSGTWRTMKEEFELAFELWEKAAPGRGHSLFPPNTLHPVTRWYEVRHRLYLLGPILVPVYLLRRVPGEEVACDWNVRLCHSGSTAAMADRSS